MEEQLEIVKILRAGLEQNVGEIGLDDAFDRRGHRRFRLNLKEDEIIVPRAMADQRGHRGPFAWLGLRGQPQFITALFAGGKLASQPEVRALRRLPAPGNPSRRGPRGPDRAAL